MPGERDPPHIQNKFSQKGYTNNTNVSNNPQPGVSAHVARLANDPLRRQGMGRDLSHALVDAGVRIPVVERG